jgi:hypothetical protein
LDLKNAKNAAMGFQVKTVRAETGKLNSFLLVQ